jgi:transcriptional regulator with XRE-family HTH domain
LDRGTERGRRVRVIIGGEVRAARVDRGLTLREVCGTVGVSASTGSRLERTVSAEAQGVEDRLTALARGGGLSAQPTFDAAAQAELAAIDSVLASVELPYEEWETLYRQRLQVERDLRRASMADSVPESAAAVVASVVKAVTDPDTVAALDKAAGREWRVGVAIASILAAGLSGLLRGARRQAKAGRTRRGQVSSTRPNPRSRPRGRVRRSGDPGQDPRRPTPTQPPMATPCGSASRCA